MKKVYFNQNYSISPPKVWQSVLIAFLLMTPLYTGATPACPIITEAFQSVADGTTVDNSSTGWYIDATNVSGAKYFAVKSHRFQAENLGGIGIWYSRVFSVAGYSDFQVTVKVSSEGTQNSSEYVSVYYKVNGGSETLIATKTGNFGTYEFTSPSLVGSNVQMIVKIYNYNNGSSQTSKYYVEQYRVYKETGPCGSAIAISASAGNNGILTCSTPSLTLSASSTASGVTYSWTGPNSFTSTSQNPVVSTAGTYTVVGTSSAGSGSASVVVTSNKTAPDVSATGGTLACGASVTLHASSSVSGVTYSWSGPSSFTSTSQNPVVSTAGTYTVTVTNPTNGCATSQSASVGSGTATATTQWLEDFTFSDGTNVDNGSTAWTRTYTGTTGYWEVRSNKFVGSYLGTQAVWKSQVIDISKLSNITVSIDVTGEGSLNINEDYFRAYYIINGGSETSFISYNQDGAFSATTTSPALNGNTLQIVVRAYNTASDEIYRFDNVKVMGVSPAVTLASSVSGPVTCTSSAQINITPSGTVSSYSWTGPNSFTSTLQNPTVSSGGEYVVTATLPSGCAVSAPVTVSENKTVPDVTATGGSLSCSTSFTLNANSSIANAAYSWSGPNNFTSTLKNPTVNTAGTYAVTVTNPSNGCTASTSVQVTSIASTTLWNEDFTFSDGTVSDNGTTSWTVTNTSSGTFAVASNEFKINNIGTSTEGVWTSGLITISGNTASISADVRSGVSSGGALENSGSSLDYIRFYYKLNGGSEVLFQEFLGTINNNSATNTSISVGSLSGSTLQIVVRARTTASDEFYYFDNIKITGVTQSGVDASANANGTLTCTNTAVTLNGSSTTAGVSYSWTGPNGFTSTLQNPTTSSPGTYTLTTSNNAGCSASASVNVLQDIAAPVATAGVSGTLGCSTSSVTLSGSSSTSGVTYNWSGPNSFISTSQNPVVTTAGTYSLTVTNPANGCTSSQSVQVTTNNTLSTIWLEDFTLTDGSTNDSGTTSWSSSSSTGTFTVSGNAFKITNTGTSAEGVWTSGTIDISGKTNVTISIDERSAVTGGALMNNSGTYIDYVRVYYKINGGSEVLGYETLGSINNNSTTNTTFSVGSLSGSTIQLVIRARASGSDEFYYLDNIRVSGISALTASASAGGSLTCSTSSVILSGSSNTSGVTYSWSGPGSFSSTSQNPTVSAAGTYTLTVTNPANGCTATATTTVTSNTIAPGASASVSGTLTCSNTSVILTGSSSTSGVTYSWSGPGNFTSTSQNPSVSTAGTYNLTVTNPINGCSSSANIAVSQNNTLPDITATGGTLNCSGTVTLSVSSSVSGVTYSWSGPNSFTSTNQNPVVSTTGIYTATVSNPANGCVNSQAVQVTNVISTLWLEDFTLTDGTTSDAGSTSWTSSSSTGTFSVSGNTFKVTNIGTSSEGVWTSGTIDITGKTSVNVSADLRSAVTGGALMNTSGTYIDYVRIYYKLNGGSEVLASESLGSINSNSSTATTVSFGPLSTGTTLQLLIRARASGSDEFYYIDNVKVTATGSASLMASASASGALTCSNASVTLSGNSNTSGVTYSWTGPGNFSSSSQNPVVTSSGTYNLTVSNGSCTGSASITVNENKALPGASASGGTITCSVTAISLAGSSSTSGVTYAWSGPGSFSSSLQNPSVTTPGSYNLTVTNPSNGCSSTAVATVSPNNTLPGANGIGGNLTCTKTSVTLTGSSSTLGVTYSWSGPGFTSSTQNPTVSAAGTYTLTVTNPTNGCTSTDTAMVSQNITVPEANGIGGNLTCTKTSVNLTGSSSASGVTYSWAGPGFTSSTQNPTVNAAGTYTLTVTNPANGCTSTDTAKVTQNISVPGANGIGGGLTCTKTSVTLTGSSSISGVTYSWSGPSFTSSAQNPTVSAAGTYTLTVTNPANGCTSTDTAMVSQNITVPGANGIGGGLTCTKTSVTLTGSSSTSGVTYSWSGPSFTSSAQNPTVSVAGTYTLTVTNPVNGCTSTDTAMVSQNITVPGANGIGGKLTCTKTSVILTGSSSTSGVTYNWSGPGFTSSVQNPTVNAAGTYTLTVTNPANGCTSTDTAMVSQNITVPGANGIGGNLTCTKTSVTLTGSSSTSGVTYSWSGPGFTSSAQNPTVSAAGTYTVTVTNPANGCTSTDTAMVSQNITVPGANGIGGKLTCTKTSVTLTGSSSTSGVTYSWSGPGFTSSVQNPTVNAAGTYTLTVINPINGCTSADTAIVSLNNQTYIATAIGGVITCTNTSITLSGNSSGSGSSYNWSGPGSYTSTAQNPVVSAVGTYTLTVTNQNNGCTSSDTAMVTVNNTQPGASASVSNILTCNTTATTLSGGSPTTGVTYRWSGPSNFASTEQYPVTNHSGTYTLTVTNPANGCTSTKDVTVSRDTTTAAGVNASVSGTLNCTVKNVTLAGSSSTSGVTYNWTGPNSYGSGNQSIVVSTPGNYILHVSNSTNGCITTTTASVLQDTIKPVVTITSSGIFSCTASSVTLLGSSAPNGVSYTWSGPSFSSTGSVANVTNPGSYSVTVTNPGNNCSTTNSVTVVKDLTPPAEVSASVSGALTCTSPTVIVSASSLTSGVVYNWAGPANYTSNERTPHVSNPGNYVVTVTDPYNNCSVTKSVDVSQNIAVPEGVIVSVSDILSCYNASVTLSGSSTTAGVSYRWTGPAGYTSDQQNPIVDVPGTYTLTVANSNNGCTTVMPLVVEQDTITPADVLARVSGALNCRNTSVILTGSTSSQNVDYEWDAPNGNFITSNPSVVVVSPGAYTLIVTNSVNGCSTIKTATVASDKTPPSSSIIPSTLSPIALSSNTLSAQTVTNASYAWTFSSANSNWSIASGSSSQVMTYQAGDAGSNATFVLTVTNNGNGCSSTSQAALTAVSSLKNALLLADNDAQKSFSFKAYPNPFTSKATLEFITVENSHITVELHSGVGKLESILFDSDALSSQTYKISIDGSKMPSGTHYIVIRTGSELYSQKIILLN